MFRGKYFQPNALIAIFTIAIISAVQQANGMQAAAEALIQDIARNGQREAQRIAAAAADRARNNELRVNNLRQEIDALANRGVVANDPRIIERQAQIAEIRRNQNKEEKWDEVARDVVGGGMNLFLEQAKGAIQNEREEKAHKRELERDTAKAAAQGHMENLGKRERMADEQKNWMAKADFLTNPQTLKRMVMFALGLCVTYYGVKITAQEIQARLGKPSLVRESSRHSILQDIIDGIMGKAPAPSLQDIVLSPDIQAKVNLLADDAKETRALGLTYQNILFYGPPGTGKTEFAKILAYYSGMDYAILSGADFAQFQNGEGITEMHKLFEWAKKSRNGLLIFIDEADACFRDRATQDKDGVNIVNAFLSHTGGNSDKFMIVLATNYEDELDGAVRSRMHKKMPFMLPTEEVRLGILQKKFEKYILNDSRTFERDGSTVVAHLMIAPDINLEYLKVVAQKMIGFSGRDIDQAVSEMRLRAYRSGNNTLNKALVDEIIKDKIIAIEKDKQATEYQRQRFNARTKHAAAAA